jgi:hypothetical protein
VHGLRFIVQATSEKRRVEMTNVNVTTKCEECGASTGESFAFGGGLHYFCQQHEEVVFAKVTGKAAKPSKSDAKK